MTLTTAVSWLFVPATRPERFAKATASGADAVIIDLEDAVAEADKATAREALRAHWPADSPVPVVVRVNAAGTPEAAADLALCRELSPAAVVLPKAESARDVLAVGGPVLPLIETARGLVNLAEIAAAEPVVRLLFGSIDLALDLGVTDDAALDPSRSDLVRWSVVSSLPAPVDGVSTAIRDTEVVTRDATRAKGWGFGGKLCIHPVQVPLVHAAFAPSAAEVDWARRVLAVDLDGAASLDGEMIDRPVVERARRIVREAERA
ncbi:CoA ester lyase [Amycolatopsis sp. 195334CR]|uniref:HpcH/HpaI aldolase/citrate lyase family protein n=1 Tax=Amycolatopsis sp. 195334CR TaxID=2814588 RepID=UPI001A8D73E3|nr:CoA ester lyase [Amycolatopsis sp. 195334CR]MBN6033984.1 CoA ester lyase [Amycolatopsis sp. 195334CR]